MVPSCKPSYSTDWNHHLFCWPVQIGEKKLDICLWYLVCSSRWLLVWLVLVLIIASLNFSCSTALQFKAVRSYVIKRRHRLQFTIYKLILVAKDFGTIYLHVFFLIIRKWYEKIIKSCQIHDSGVWWKIMRLEKPCHQRICIMKFQWY